MFNRVFPLVILDVKIFKRLNVLIIFFICFFFEPH